MINPQPDLVDQAQWLARNANQARVTATLRPLFNALADDQKLDLCREIITDQVVALIDKLPQQQQQELLATVAHQYANQWSD